MPFRHGKLTEVMLAHMIASPYLNSASINRTVETADTSAFGTAAKTYIAGHNDGSMSLSGMFDGSVGAIDELLDSVVAIEDNYAATIMYDGGIAPGRSCQFAEVKQTSYDTSSPVDGVVSLSVELQVDKGVSGGLCLTDKTQRNTSFNYPTVDFGANSGGVGRGRAAIHIPHNGRNTATQVRVQHSSDNVVWVDGATQSVSAGETGSYVVSVPGNIGRYLRVITDLTTGTGLISVIVAFARN